VKVLIVTHAPDAFADAVDLALARGLATGLRSAGDVVEVIALPFGGGDDPVRELAAVRMIDFSPTADLVICLTAVAAAVRHPRKVTWFDRGIGDALVPGSPLLDDRLLAECARRRARTETGLRALHAGNFEGELLAVPSDHDGWARAAEDLAAWWRVSERLAG
jgi:hypothetical protein